MAYLDDQDIHKHFHQYKTELHLIDDQDLHMEVLHLPEQTGEGVIKRMIIKSGLELVITDYCMFA